MYNEKKDAQLIPQDGGGIAVRVGISSKDPTACPVQTQKKLIPCSN